MPPENDKPQGNQAPPGQGDGGEPKFVTEEQLNRAISARFGDFQKKIEKSLGESFATSLSAKLDELKASLTPNSGGDSRDPPKGGDLENHPLVKGLQKQIADQKTATEQMKAERDAEKALSRDQVLRSQLTDKLTKGGVDPRYVRKAVGDLVDVEKRVRFGDDGDELVFKDATGDVDLETGLKGWLKSDDAKIYMPPRGTKGSGDQRDGRPSSNGQQPAAMTAGRALLGMALGTVAGANTNE